MSLNSSQVKTSAASPASFVYFPPATTDYAILRNSSSVSVDYTINAGATVAVLASGAVKLLDLVASTAEVGVRRTDANAASVNVLIGYGFTAGDIDVLIKEAAASTAAHNASAGAHGLSATRFPPLRKAGTVVPLKTFEVLADWRAYLNCTKAVAATDSGANYTLTAAAPAGITFTMSGGGTELQGFSQNSFSPVLNISGKNLEICYRIESGTGTADPAQITGIRFTFIDAALKRVEFDLAPYSWRHGLNKVRFSQEYTGYTTTPDLTAITNFRVHLYTSAATATCSITLLSLSEIKPLTKPVVCVTFDDVFIKQRAAAAIAARYGIPVTVFITTDWVGNQNKLTLNDLLEMQKGGHLIANHSVSHPVPWSSQTLATKIAEIEGCREWLVDNGMPAGSRIFASPGGHCDIVDESSIIGSVVDLFRGTRNWPKENTEPFPPVDRTTGIPCSCWDGEQSQAETVTKLATELAACQTWGTASIELYHTFDATGYLTLAEFQTHMANIAAARDAGTIEVVRFDELLGKLA